MKRTSVADVMSTDVVSVRENASIKAVAHLLISTTVSGVPVVDIDERVVGVVSEADLLAHNASWLHRRIADAHGRWRRSRSVTPRSARSVRDVMKSPALTIGPDEPIERAAALLARHGFKRLPVVDADGVLVGIVSRRDIVALYGRSDEELRTAIAQEVLQRAMWVEPDRITVNVIDGVVTFLGEVERRSMIDVITNLTRAVAGVVDVNNELSAEHDDLHLPTAEPENVGILSRRTHG